LIIVHFAFWGFVLLPNVLIYIRDSRDLYLIHLLLWLLPSTGAILLLYSKPEVRAQAAPVGGIGLGKWTIIPAALGLAALLTIWLPRRSYSLIQPKEMGSALVELSRGPCYGSCPAYTVKIHGDGEVEYIGKRFVKVSGTQTGMVSGEAFARILQRLNQVHFFVLEDRAFSWCFDAPSVSVTVSVDGKAKTVTSDAGCSGAKAGVQDQFVRAANDIDKIIGCDRWVLCGAQGCR
jgi:hypothetical protein